LEEAVEQILGNLLSDLAPVLLSFLIANIGWLLLALVVIVFLIAIAGWVIKHKLVSGWWRRVVSKHDDSAGKLNAIITSDTFKGLEQGFVQGRTERTLSQLEERLYALHRQSEQLRNQLTDRKVPFFSLVGPLIRINRLDRNVREFSRQVDRLAHDVSGIAKTEKDTIHSVRQAGTKLSSVSQSITQLMERTGYPLDELNRELSRVEALFRQAEQTSAFDTVQAQSELTPFYRSIDALSGKIEALQKQLAIFDEMRNRIRVQTEPLVSADADVADVLSRIDPIVQRLEMSLRIGRSTDLRAAASEIEHLVQKAADLAEANRSGA
jgi:chromosome segregation ATPase